MKISRRNFLKLTATLAGSLSVSPVLSASAAGSKSSAEPLYTVKKLDKSKLARLIITTDVECDDINGLIGTAFFAGDMDIVGVVRSAGEWRWDGDRDPNDYSKNLGVTLAESMQEYVTADNPYPWRCRGEEPFDPTFTGMVMSGPKSETAGALTHYREADDNWLTDLWDVYYRAVYPNLVKHDPNFPTPDYMISITKRGNCAFEGDVRYDTEGSMLIANEILKLDDKRPLVISTMGGANTLIRALMYIKEHYEHTAQWQQIVDHIKTNVYASYYGEDDCWERSGLKDVISFAPGTPRSVSLPSYGSPDLAAVANPLYPSWGWAAAGTGYDVNKFHQGEWIKENLKTNHGALAGHFYTMLDGQYIGADWQNNAEPRIYQWCRTGIHNCQFNPYGPYPDALKDYPNAGKDYGPGWGRMYAKYDWTGFQGTGLVMGSGLGEFTEAYDWGRYGIGYGGIKGSHAGIPAMKNNGDYISGAATGETLPFRRALWEEFAARADWCVDDAGNANNAPIIRVGAEERIEDHFVYGRPGDTVPLIAAVYDPDGDKVYSGWWIWQNASNYQGAQCELKPVNPACPNTQFTIPADAKEGEYFTFIIKSRDSDSAAPITRFNNVVVHVVNSLPAGTAAPAALKSGSKKASVRIKTKELYAKPGFPVELSAKVCDLGSERDYLFWDVDKAQTAYSGAAKVLRVWDPQESTTNFTVPVDAKAGDTIVVDLLGSAIGETNRSYGKAVIHVVDVIEDEPVIKGVSVSPKNIYQGEAVDITVTVDGENLAGHKVTANILGKKAVVKNGKAVVKLTADDVFEYGIFKTQVEVEGTWIKFDTDPNGFVRAFTKPADLTAPVVSSDGAVTTITFAASTQDYACEDPWHQYPIVSLNADLSVKIGQDVIDSSKVSVSRNVVTVNAPAAAGQTVTVSNVVFSDAAYGALVQDQPLTVSAKA